jgi:hypothetical protein
MIAPHVQFHTPPEMVRLMFLELEPRDRPKKWCEHDEDDENGREATDEDGNLHFQLVLL